MITKFRAWDKADKEMLEVHGINFDAQGIWTKEMMDDESDGNFIFLTDIELLQSTGLKDKNDVEIFEGDIIDKGYHNLNIENRIGYVKFAQGEDSDGWSHGSWLGWITNNNDSLLDVHENCTVIGNMFENPELLED